MKWLHSSLLDLAKITSLLDFKWAAPRRTGARSPLIPRRRPVLDMKMETTTQVQVQNWDSAWPQGSCGARHQRQRRIVSTSWLVASSLSVSLSLSASLSLFLIGGCSWWWWLNRWSEYGEVGVKVIYYAGWTRTIKTDWLKHKTRNQQAIEACNDQRILFNLMVKTESKL